MQKTLSTAVVALFLVAAAAHSAPLPKNTTPPKEPKVEQIRKALESSIDLVYSQQNLTVVLAQLTEDHGIQFVLDKATISQMGFDDNQLMIETKQKQVKMRTGLRNMLSQYGLTLVIVGDHVLVTTEEMGLYKQFKQRISIDYNEVPLNKAFKDMSQTYGVNIVLDPKCVKAKTVDIAVTLQLEDVAFEAAVRLMSEMAGLKAARLSNIIYITTEDRADKINKDSDLVPNPNPNSNPSIPGGPGVVPPQGIPMAFPGVLPQVPALGQKDEVPAVNR